MQPIDERDNYNFDNAIRVAQSRSGTTENVRLNDGTLVEVYYCKSGKVNCQVISGVDPSLTLRGKEPY